MGSELLDVLTLLSVSRWEYAVYLVIIGIFYAGVWLVFKVFDYGCSVLSHATGWNKDDIMGTTIFLIVGPVFTICIHSSLKEAHQGWRKTHPGHDLSLGKRFLRWTGIWIMAFLAAIVLVFSMVMLGVR